MFAPTLTPPAEKATYLENDFVWVRDVSLQPGEELPLHAEGDRTDYAATCSVELGICAERVFKAGDVRWYYAGFFKLENIEQTPAHLLIVGLKR